MLELKITIGTTPELTEAINNLAAAIGGKAIATPQQPVANAPVNPAPVAPAPAPTPVPLAAAPQFTVDQIMNAGASLMDTGKIDDLMNLLHSFGVQAVMELKPEQLGAFATELRKLGAAI